MLGHEFPISNPTSNSILGLEWLKSIEFTDNYKHIGMGQGGYREDSIRLQSSAGIRLKMASGRGTDILFDASFCLPLIHLL